MNSWTNLGWETVLLGTSVFLLGVGITVAIGRALRSQDLLPPPDKRFIVPNSREPW